MSELQYLHSVKRMPLMGLPVCTVVVPLREARVLISPGSMLTVEELRSVGAVTDIVAPNLLHTAGVPRAAEVFPGARLWGPVGAAAAKPAIRWNGELTESAWPFDGELTVIPLEGLPRIRESLFLHRASRTLIVTDLAFNMKDIGGLGAWIFLNLFGTYQRFAVSRLFAQGVRDSAAFEKSLERLFSHDFERVVVSHGAVEEKGRQKLLDSLRERGFTPRA